MFYVPEFGYNKMLDANRSVAVIIYGNGGMNTGYLDGQISTPPGSTFTGPAFLGFPPSKAGTTPARCSLPCGSTRSGVDLMQRIIAPTFAMKACQNHSFGVSPLIGQALIAALRNCLRGLCACGYHSKPAVSQGRIGRMEAFECP